MLLSVQIDELSNLYTLLVWILGQQKQVFTSVPFTRVFKKFSKILSALYLFNQNFFLDVQKISVYWPHRRLQKKSLISEGCQRNIT